jgi:5-(carboxyamino)imidazole ribonucleotide synthase
MKVGVLGAGQLGQMLALAGTPLGLTFRFLDPTPDSPARHVGEQYVGNYTHKQLLERFAHSLDVVTYEFENVPVSAVKALQRVVSVYPPPIALEVAQDRFNEKTLFQELGIPTPRFATIDSAAQLEQALDDTGVPAILKTRRMGYDGKGQAVIDSADTAESARLELGGSNLILEERIAFEREVSLLSVRGLNGETAFYPLIENHHRGGILRTSYGPAPGVSAELQAQAESYGQALMERLGYVGLLAVEFFLRDGQLIANEMAPRVHNSGHGTIEGAVASQFENHLRAICGLPLGSAAMRSSWRMENIIGDLCDVQEVLRQPGAHLHLYGKEPRPGRKLGHITHLSADTGVTF